MGSQSEYEKLGKYMESVYASDWWKQCKYDDNDAFDIWRAKFGLNSSDGRYGDDAEQKQDEQKGNEMELSIGNGTGSSTVKIHLFGATVINWTVNGEEQLFVSGQSKWDQSKAIRGGIPVVFPQFGPG